jgi:hypothetical protein
MGRPLRQAKKPKKNAPAKSKTYFRACLRFFLFFSLARWLVVANSFGNLALGTSWALQCEEEVSLKDFCLNIVCLELSCLREFLRM